MDKKKDFHTVRGYQLMEQHRRLLTPAMEDYLEMIYRGSLETGYIRINTLAELLHVQPPSATKMVQKLASIQLVKYQKYGIILLTDTGMNLGKYLFDRHNTIERFLSNIGVNENLLIETELMEHNISASTLHRFNMINDFISDNPEVVELFNNYIKSRES